MTNLLICKKEVKNLIGREYLYKIPNYRILGNRENYYSLTFVLGVLDVISFRAEIFWEKLYKTE